jgi:hypothetical protein
VLSASSGLHNPNWQLQFHQQKKSPTVSAMSTFFLTVTNFQTPSVLFLREAIIKHLIMTDKSEREDGAILCFSTNYSMSVVTVFGL